MSEETILPVVVDAAPAAVPEASCSEPDAQAAHGQEATLCPELAPLDLPQPTSDDHGDPGHEVLAQTSVPPVDAPKPAITELSPAATAARLAELFPAVFGSGGPRPLKLRIQADVQQRVPATFTKKMLSIFLQRYTTGTAYLKALANAIDRVDLDGLPAGAVSDEHRQAAVAELARRRELHDARRAAEREAQRNLQKEAQRESQKEAQRLALLAHQEQQADDAGRRDRAGLLRAFETTTLTRSNFCALKRLPEAELDALLAQARTERAERPLPQAQPPIQPRPAQARPPRNDARPGERTADRERRPSQGRPSHRRPTGGTKPAP